MSDSARGWLQQFYLRLLHCRRPEVIIVILFLTLIVVFQMSMAHVFQQANEDDDSIEEPARAQRTMLSHQEALWEVQVLQEQVRQKQEEVTALEKNIEQLNRVPPERPKKPMANEDSASLSAVPYYSFDKHGAYSTSGLFESDTGFGGFREALVNEFNAIGVYIIAQYNTNFRGGIFWKTLQRKSELGNLTFDHFRMGLYRYIPQIGVEYQIYFGDPSPIDVKDHYLYKIQIDQPVEQPPHYSVEHVNSQSNAVNIVVSLKGRLETLASFLLHLAKLKASLDFNFHLTIAYFGNEGLQRVYTLISDAKKLGFRNIRLIELPEEQFSRGLGIQRSLEKSKTGNDVMFICDVDVIIKPEFLERCAMYASRGKSVYYPIVFSLYNPHVVAFFTNVSSNAGNQPSEDLLGISRQKGFWRDFGYGMFCVHRSDFFKVRGYREWTQHVDGDGDGRRWGYEDVDMFKRFVAHRKLSVIRAPDPGLFHVWHPKHCSPQLAPEMLKQCRTSMVANEGSHRQMGLLHYPSIYQDFIAANGSLSMQGAGIGRSLG